MKKLILFLLLFVSCTKEESATVSYVDYIDTEEKELAIAKEFQGRDGKLLHVFNIKKFVFDNYILAGTPGYLNEQILLNKDDVMYVMLEKQNFNNVVINTELNSIYKIKVIFKNDSLVYNFPELVYASADADEIIYPDGINYGHGVNHFLTYVRTSSRMTYYDNKFYRFKTKFYYQVNGIGIAYRDYIPGTLEKSSVFRI